ncbi:MAG: hypothetical protein A2046_14155 [Bacteroidetes bacterium GWA2_30_7]|nr:MAG: hypothetical protein A2046_14155 [Bacteroidetes bacterium GWA2_30_7]
MKTPKLYLKYSILNCLSICVLLLLSIIFEAFSQDYSKINEFKAQLKNANNDSLKIESLIKLSGLYAGSNTDTSMQYARKALNMAQSNSNRSLLARCYHTLGVTHYYKSDYNDALEYYFKALKINEELNNQKEIGSVCNNIGNVYWMQDNLDGALEFYFRDLKIAKELGDEVSAAKTIGNIGLIYDNKGDSDKALEYYKNGAILSEKLGDKDGTTNAFINIGNVYQGKKELNEAIKYLLKAYDIALVENNKDALALVFINAGSCYLDMKNFEKAEEFLKKAETYSKEIGSKNYLRYAYRYLSNLYYKKKDYKSSLEYYNQSVLLKDSIFNEEKSKQMAEMQTQFETEKKQKQIEIQKLKLDQKDLEINKKQFVIYGTSAGFILMILLALIIFRSYRQKKKSNEIILSQNKSLEQANEEISTQRDEIEAQRDILNGQNKILEVVNTKITDSINYAKYIQQAVLPSDIILNNNLNDYFILFKPKDIVSGDFYWVTKVNDSIIVAVADCTGHGVPGAFMSMLGISFLNEIVRKNEVNQANQVLNLLRISVIDALSQTGRNEEQKDGMDMSLIAIKTQASSTKFQDSNEEEGEKVRQGERENKADNNQSSINNNQSFNAQWAGANNPLWLIRSSKEMPPFEKVASLGESAVTQSSGLLVKPVVHDTETTNQRFVLQEIKPDKMPIAIYDIMNNFTNHELQLHKDDIIYLMTDGYEDAIGGPKGKKFMSKNLKQLLADNYNLPMYKQKEILESTLVGWIGNEEQLDDVTLMGIRL